MTALTTLESFTGGTDGADPGYGSLLMDGNGDLFGTTLSGGPKGGGTVFELVNTGSGFTLQTLASFDANDSVNGNTPFAGLTMDANGNLFGVTQAGGATGAGTVFELAKAGSGYGGLQTLASFSTVNGSYPTGALLADASGNLFGTTQSGGDNGDGTVFELVNTGSGYTLNTLLSFNYDNGSAPTGPLIADAAGNLFGTTLQGGSGTQGTVFEMVHGALGYTLQTLANFDGSNGSFLYSGLVADANGDLFGSTYSGGAGGYGTVYELVKTDGGYSSVQTIAALDYDVSGGYSIGGLTIDAQGDIFGTALAGGANGFGTVFELVHGSSGYTLQTLYSFQGTDGALPEGTLTLDESGNLYGTTVGGGAADGSGAGTVFEISAAAPTNEQANLALKVNGGSGNPVGAAGEHAVAFTVGGLEPGDTGVVTFTDAANHTVTVDVTSGQTHYIADFGTLSDGAVSASLQVATNSSGDSFTPVAGNVVTLDTAAPGQPGAPTDASVSNGYVNAAHDTAAQAIGGTAEAGAAVAVYDNGGLVATVTADNSGAWTYNVGTLTDGSAHSFAVTATDAAGNTSALSGALNFTVDTSAPDPDAPADTAVVNGYVNAAHDTAGQTIGGMADAGSSVAIYDNGALVTTVTADNAGAWTYNVGILADGSSHSYAVTATDGVGNTSALSQALTFTVDASAPGQPGAPADAAVSGGYVNAAHDTAGQTIGGVTEAGASVAIYDNGSLVTSVSADNAGAWTYDVGALADGSSHSYAVTATDAAGNTSAMSGTLAFTVDTVAPASEVDTVTVGGDGASTVSGSAEAGSTVMLYDGASLIGSVTAGSGGAWSVPVGVLADGSSHSYTVTATDAAGNTSAVSGALGYTAPSAPADPPAQPATPTDSAVHNGYVNAAGDAAGQTIGGTTEAGALVTIYDQGTQVTTVTADNSGAWSYQVGALADGSSHSYAVTATNAGGVSALSGTLSFIVDASAPGQPGAPADAAVAGGYVNAAHDTAGQSIGGTTEVGASVAVYDNGVLVKTVTADNAGAWTYNVGTLADGSTHSYAVTATDGVGNTSAMSLALNFSVDTSAPGQPAAPADAAVLGGYVNAAHDTAGQTIGGATEVGASVAIYDNGVLVTTVTADNGGAWTYNIGALADGSAHSYAVTATDAAGNTSAMSGALGFTVDTSAPGRSGAPADAAVSGGYVNAAHDTAGQTIGGMTEAGASVAIYDNGSLVTTVTADNSGAWAYQVGILANGSTHSYAVTATDAAGNTSALSQALGFAVDTVAPASAVAAVTVGGGGVATVSGSAEAGSTVMLYDGANLLGSVTAGSGGTWSVPVGVLADGSSHSYAVTATDAAGNTSGLSSALSYTAPSAPSDPTDPPADPPARPAAPTDAAVHNGYVNKASDTAAQTIGGTTEAGALVTIYDHGTLVTTVTANGSGAWSYQVGVLASGSTHSYAVTATNAGGVSAISSALNFTVDSAAPGAPTGLADSAISHGYVNKGHNKADQTLTGHAEAGALVTVYDNGVKLGTATANASTGAWSFHLGVLASGAQSLTATATDAAGNTSAPSAALVFSVDAKAPAPAVDNITDAGKGLSTIHGTSEAGSTVTVYDYGRQVGVATAGADGSWSLTAKLPSGSVQVFTETATDAAGNKGFSAGGTYWAHGDNRYMIGWGGNDVFVAHDGDMLTGLGGNDHYVFDPGFGRVTVTDFRSGSDQLWFDHTLFGSASQVLASAHKMNGNTVITDAAGDKVVLYGVQPNQLHAGDFHFF